MESIPPEIRNRVPCQISPFGSPRNSLIPTNKERKQDRLLKILFVGSMSQRKGLADIFEAMKLLKKDPVKLSILGQPSMPMEFYRKQCSDFKYYPPCTHTKVREIMLQHDALILPSIVEGRALVQQEALSCGLPIIVTKNAGAEELIDEGITGYLIPIRCPEKIAEKVLSFLNNKQSRMDIAHECIKKAQSYTWSGYAQKIIDFNLEKPTVPVQFA